MTGNLFMWRTLLCAGTQNQTSLLELITKFPLETSHFSSKNMLMGLSMLRWLYSLLLFPGEGNGNPLQDYCLENPTDRGALGYSSWGHEECDVNEHTCSQAFNKYLLNNFTLFRNMLLFVTIKNWQNSEMLMKYIAKMC